ncbi:uncharacterized protein [Physcomitrium patens]|uniref:uncharacterized protein isoform X3 n=1 Tax=Physcomitrium patens TaxID=3218 RepID=UPI000D1779AC|nr:uncharacterized protein LOC112295351 isoform X3 [Physcomitrium patens]|eukprot:XP_024402595.1 uncharacterized protein LOC112295351 isoform X3 [Physcomitrella patens]
MYRRYLKPCTYRFHHEFNSQDVFASCQSMLRGISPTFWRRAQVQRRRVFTSSSHSWLSCQGFDCIPSIPSALLLLRQQRLLVGHALRGYITTSAGVINPSRQSLFPQKERLLRISSSFTRSCSDERGTDGKSQADVSSSIGSGGDNYKGAEYVMACSSGGEDESDEGLKWRHSATTSGNQDESSIESFHHDNQDSLYLAQKARFRKAFEERLQRWEDAKVTLEEFPHYLSETTRDLLVDCAAAHLRQPLYAEFGSGLSYSNRRICLRGSTGTLLYQERLVEALAHHLQAPLLVLDSTSLAPHDFGAHELISASSSDGSDSENESTSALSDGEKDEGISERMRGARDVKVDVLLEVAADSVQVERQHASMKETIVEGSGEKQGRGKSAGWKENRASALSPGNVSAADPCEEWVAAIDALSEMSSRSKPMVIYFPDPRHWFERAVPLDRRQEFLERVEAKLDQIEGPIVMIASRLSDEKAEVDDRARLKAHLEDIRSRLNQRTSTRWVFRDLLGSEDVYELFPNHIKIYPPKEDGMLREWKKQLLKDKEISRAKHNIGQLREVLETNYMDCEGLPALNLLGLDLSKTKAEKVVGWARNHHLGMSLFDPPTSNGKLMIPRDSMERALTRLRVQENKKPPSIVKDFKTVAEDEYEKALISAVIPPNEVSVKFDHIGALEDVKSALKELVMLPLQRPELFCKGNLTRPCKGVLLFGPPGTGKTLLAKAVATEAGANFINITGSTITSKWFGDAEKLTKSLFSLAKKLAPAVIFVDEFIGGQRR